MPSLHELQREFGDALLAKEPAISWGMRAYRNNVFGNWGGALANAFPIVRKIVGAEFFDAMAREYGRANPSTSGDLNEYGARLPGFVAAFPHTQDLPYLPDVARMEWLAHLAYYAADAAPFDARALAAIPSENFSELRFKRAPGSALLRSDWPLERIWTVHQNDYTGDPAVDLKAGLERVFIYRPRWRIEVCSITLGDYRFLAGAGRGELLGDLIEAAFSLDPSFDPSVALARWMQAGVIAL